MVSRAAARAIGQRLSQDGGIRDLAGETTVLAISHRSAFLDIADRVCELADGRVVSTEASRTLPSRAR